RVTEVDLGQRCPLTIVEAGELLPAGAVRADRQHADAGRVDVGILDAGVPGDRLGLDASVRIEHALLGDSLIGTGDRYDAAVGPDRHLVDVGRAVSVSRVERT